MKTATCNIHSVTVYNSDGTTDQFTFDLKPSHPRKPKNPDYYTQAIGRTKRQAPRVPRYRGRPLANTIPI